MKTTAKDLAQSLSVSVDTIYRTAKNLGIFPSFAEIPENGTFPANLYTEKQAKAIRQAIESKQEVQSDWLTIEELAELTGISPNYLRNKILNNFNRPQNFNIEPQTESLVKVQKEKKKALYHKDILKYIKEWQISNSFLPSTVKMDVALKENSLQLKTILTSLDRKLDSLAHLLPAPNPRGEQFAQLDNWVNTHLTVDTKKIHRVLVSQAHHEYTYNTPAPTLGQHEFMHYIMLNHPEFELREIKREFYFFRCKYINGGDHE